MGSHLSAEQLSSYLDGGAGSQEVEDLERHLASCEGCRAELASLQRITASIRRLEQERQPPAPLPSRGELQVRRHVRRMHVLQYLVSVLVILALILPLVLFLFDASARFYPAFAASPAFRPIFGSLLSLLTGLSLLLFLYLLGVTRAGWRNKPSSSASRDAAPKRDPIDELYTELRQLMARRSIDPAADAEFQSRFRRLRALQHEEAEMIRQRLDAGLYLKPGTGYQSLQEARALLHAHPSPKDLPSSR